MKYGIGVMNTAWAYAFQKFGIAKFRIFEPKKN